MSELNFEQIKGDANLIVYGMDGTGIKEMKMVNNICNVLEEVLNNASK